LLYYLTNKIDKINKGKIDKNMQLSKIIWIIINILTNIFSTINYKIINVYYGYRCEWILTLSIFTLWPVSYITVYKGSIWNIIKIYGPYIVIIGVLDSVQNTLLCICLNYITASEYIICRTTSMLFNFFIKMYMDKKIKWQILAANISVFLSIGFLLSDLQSSYTYFLLCFLASFVYSIENYLTEKKLDKDNLLIINPLINTVSFFTFIVFFSIFSLVNYSLILEQFNLLFSQSLTFFFLLFSLGFCQLFINISRLYIVTFFDSLAINIVDVVRRCTVILLSIIFLNDIPSVSKIHSLLFMILGCLVYIIPDSFVF